MQLLELFRKVKEKSLDKEQLEEYRDELVGLFAEIQIELADLKKEKAIYFVEKRVKTNTDTERNWFATKHGQREIELSHYSKALEKIISSAKDRLYRLY